MNQVYQIITDQITDKLQHGVVPWRQPWSGTEPTNLISRKPYRGINRLLLGIAGYASPYWLTYKQAANMSGHVRKGEKSTMVIFWRHVEVTATAAGGETEPDTVPILRYYRVFNAEQVDGIAGKVPAEVRNTGDPQAAAETIVEGYANRPSVEDSGRAAYSPAKDLVYMPPWASFTGGAGYYSTLFHELVHSTGHKSRLNRLDAGNLAAFGSAQYSREELVAELGAAFLCHKAGLLPAVVDNQAAYIGGWLQALNDDPKLVIQAASKAQAAADYIQGKAA